jgi:hypothetical protein
MIRLYSSFGISSEALGRIKVLQVDLLCSPGPLSMDLIIDLAHQHSPFLG